MAGERIYTIEQLKKHLDLDSEEESQLREVIKLHPMAITPYYLSLINKKDKKDPIRKMIVPSEEELDTTGSYDTSGEQENTKSVGLQHKYTRTALILATNRCAAYCRHCFRKRLVGVPNHEVLSRFSDAVEYIKSHKEIDNVLITGGDAFMLPTKIIRKFLELVSPIPHVRYIRFATRTPVVLPNRISKDKELLELLKEYNKKKKLYIITHFNHPREITKQSILAVKHLHKTGVIGIYNQTVLLKGVNNDPKILVELWNKLIKINILPYYLFQCRPVKRVKSHFAVSLHEGIRIFNETKKELKGHILCKRVKYVMSHKTGKIEVLGVLNNEIYFKYHRAKDPKDFGKFFKRKLNKKATWLDELK